MFQLIYFRNLSNEPTSTLNYITVVGKEDMELIVIRQHLLSPQKKKTKLNQNVNRKYYLAIEFLELFEWLFFLDLCIIKQICKPRFCYKGFWYPTGFKRRTFNIREITQGSIIFKKRKSLKSTKAKKLMTKVFSAQKYQSVGNKNKRKP